MFERIPVEIDPATFRGCRNNTLLTRSEIVGFGCLKAGRIKIIEGAPSVHPSVLASTAVVEIHNHLDLQGEATSGTNVTSGALLQLPRARASKLDLLDPGCPGPIAAPSDSALAVC